MIRFSWSHKGLTQTLADRCCQPSNKPPRFHSDLLAGFLVLHLSDQPSINGNLLWLNYPSDAELFKWFSDETSFDSFSAVILTSGASCGHFSHTRSHCSNDEKCGMNHPYAQIFDRRSNREKQSASGPKHQRVDFGEWFKMPIWHILGPPSPLHTWALECSVAF